MERRANLLNTPDRNPEKQTVMVDLRCCATIPSHLIVRYIADEAVLLNLLTERYYTLDSVSCSMLRQSTRCASLAQAIEALLDEYEVERERLVEDFTTFINQLCEAGLIEIVPPPPLQ
ncbi:MAG: PqqD family protein [Chloracidobacterium sp. CP2_5A]|nr:MAG: PqqD family protein [Chloracidobacterium sp. CP2_5A]